mgnify:CR=1 FL=1
MNSSSMKISMVCLVVLVTLVMLLLVFPWNCVNDRKTSRKPVISTIAYSKLDKSGVYTGSKDGFRIYIFRTVDKNGNISPDIQASQSDVNIIRSDDSNKINNIKTVSTTDDTDIIASALKDNVTKEYTITIENNAALKNVGNLDNNNNNDEGLTEFFTGYGIGKFSSMK